MMPAACPSARFTRSTDAKLFLYSARCAWKICKHASVSNAFFLDAETSDSHSEHVYTSSSEAWRDTTNLMVAIE